MNELYWIATNKNLDLDVRYSAARQMQNARTPERVIIERENYTERERKMIRTNTPAKETAIMLGRSIQAVYNQRKTLIRRRFS